MKLGQITKDKITGAQITPFSLVVLNKENTNRRVCVQPKGIVKETGKPFEAVWATEERLAAGPIEAVVPSHLIGEKVECIDSGLVGVIEALRVDYNGCVHAEIVPIKLTPAGNIAPSIDVDTRRLKGKNIPVYTEEALAKSHKENPSPAKCSLSR